MHTAALEQIPLCCPACLKEGPAGIHQKPLKLSKVLCRDRDHILEGFLECADPQCKRIYPIIEGIPVLLKDLPKWWYSFKIGLQPEWGRSSEIRSFLMKLDPKEEKSLQMQSRLSATIESHYNTCESGALPAAGLPCQETLWDRIEGILPLDGGRCRLSLDLGCAVGKLTEKMSRISDVAVGIDTCFDSLAFAERLHRNGRATWNRRISGIRYEKKTMTAKPRENVCFIAADALNPPFPAKTFHLVAGLNLLDSIRLPLVLLGQMDALLNEKGILLLSSPYEWRPDICDPSEWLEWEEKEAPAVVRGLLEGELRPDTGFHYKILREENRIPWFLRNHDRYWSLFFVHLIMAEKQHHSIRRIDRNGKKPN